MKGLAIALVGLMAAAPVHAEDNTVRDGMDLLSEGTQLLLRGLMDEIEPALRDIEPALRDLRPFITELRDMLPNVDLYHLPEVLPNGDIIIRRKEPLDAPRGDIEI